MAAAYDTQLLLHFRTRIHTRIRTYVSLSEGRVKHAKSHLQSCALNALLTYGSCSSCGADLGALLAIAGVVQPLLVHPLDCCCLVSDIHTVGGCVLEEGRHQSRNIVSYSCCLWEHL